MISDKFISVSVNRIQQLVNKEMFTGVITIDKLKEIVKYTNRVSNPIDPFNVTSINQVSEELKYYQRIKSSERAYDIKLFFLKHIYNSYYFEELRVSPLATFPSSIIIALNSNESKSESEYFNYLQIEEKPNEVYIQELKEKEVFNLLIPKFQQSLIVDGQHRIAGLELLLEEAERGYLEVKRPNKNDYYLKREVPFEYIIEKIKTFQFVVSFLCDFDLYEQSEIFVTVNFHQQKVNKSFYYDIFGSMTTTKSIEKLLHDITSHLNYKEDSPLYRHIKMLGSGPGFFSQAFFVDALMPLFKSGTFRFVYDDYQLGSDEYKKVVVFLKAYFKAAFTVFSDFIPNHNNEKRTSSVLVKTTGIGALIRLMPHIFTKIKNDLKIITPMGVLGVSSKLLEDQIITVFQTVNYRGESYFSENGPFSKGSGKGLQSKLFETIGSDLGFISNSSNSVEPDF